MAGLEKFIERYLGPRRSEYGATEDELRGIEMPAPLRRFCRFAGRWPAQRPNSVYQNRFSVQDSLCAITNTGCWPALHCIDDLLVFVWENQGVWVAATERDGADPPVWISEDSSHRYANPVWRQLEQPLSHFLVSFVLQELMFGSEFVAAAPDALSKMGREGLLIEPIWIDGEYAYEHTRPTFSLVENRILLRRAPEDGDGDDWYGWNDQSFSSKVSLLGLPTCI
jgi:hypothetical protein